MEFWKLSVKNAIEHRLVDEKFQNLFLVCLSFYEHNAVLQMLVEIWKCFSKISTPLQIQTCLLRHIERSFYAFQPPNMHLHLKLRISKNTANKVKMIE